MKNKTHTSEWCACLNVHSHTTLYRIKETELSIKIQTNNKIGCHSSDKGFVLLRLAIRSIDVELQYSQRVRCVEVPYLPLQEQEMIWSTWEEHPSTALASKHSIDYRLFEIRVNQDQTSANRSERFDTCSLTGRQKCWYYISTSGEDLWRGCD